MRLRRAVSLIMLAGTAVAPLSTWAEGRADESVAAPDTGQTDPRASPDPRSTDGVQPNDEEQSLGLSGTGSGSGDDSAVPRGTASANDRNDPRGSASPSTPLGAADGSQDAQERQQRSWTGP